MRADGGLVSAAVTRRNWNPFLRFPRASLAVTALLCLPLLLPLPRFGVSAELKALLQGDQRNLASYEQVREILGDTDVLVVSLELTNLFSNAGLETVRRLSDAFERQPDVVEVKSLTHSVKPVRRGLSFDMVPLVPDGRLAAAELAELKRFCLAHPLVRNVMVAADGQHTLVTVQYDHLAASPSDQERFRTQAEAVLAPFRAAGLSLRVLAVPLIADEIRATLRHDLVRFLPAACFLVVLVLWLTFRSVRLTLFTLVNQVTVLALLPGVVQAAGSQLNVFSVMLLPLLTGIHLTLLMHLLTAYRRAANEGLAADAAIHAALRTVLRPAALSTLTTVLGLVSLTFGGVPQMIEFGRLGALCLAVVHGFTFGPGLAMLKLVATRWPLARRSAISVSVDGSVTGDFAGRWVGCVQAGRRWIVSVAVLTAVFAAWGLTRVRTDVRMIETLSPASPTRQALEELDRVYGGINVVQIDFDSGRANGLNDPVFLRYLEAVHRFAESRPETTGAFSYPQLLAMVNQIWEGGRPEALKLPENPLLIGLFTTAIRSYNFPFLAALADPAARTAELVVRTRDLPASRYLHLIREIQDYATRTAPAGVSVSAARGMHSILEADRRILRSQVDSAAGAVALIAVLLAALWRSVRLAALAVIANAVPVALVLACAGFAQLPLNSITVMVGAVALGIVEDDTVHFLTHWREERRAGRSPAEAVRETLRVKGPPIIWTTVILVAVLGLFTLSSFPPVVHFGLLLAGTFVAAQASVLVLVPAWLSGPGLGLVKPPCARENAPQDTL